MEGKKKDSNIHLPADFVLSEEGLRYCTEKSIPVRDVPIGDKRKEGFSWEFFRAPLVQKLIKNRVISAISVSRAEFLSKRKEVIDLTKLLMYGLFYARLSPTMKTIFGGSDIISEIQKFNPQLQIRADTKIDPKAVEQFMLENEEMIVSFKTSIVEPSFNLLDRDSQLKERERNEKKQV